MKAKPARTLPIGAASISGFLPRSGGPNTTVTVNGSNLTGVTGVNFNGTPTFGFGSGSGTSVHCTVPAGATSGPITVKTQAHGTAVSPQSFMIQAGLPVVNSFSPTSGPSGTEVTFYGSNLTSVSGVVFNGTRAYAWSLGSGPTVTAEVPDGATSGPVTIETYDHGSTTTVQSFTVLVIT
jgi:hypothetical protein